MTAHDFLAPAPLERTRTWLAEHGVDAVVLGEPWIRWATGYHHYGAGPSALIVRAVGPARLWTSALELDAAQARVDEDVVELACYTDQGLGVIADPTPALAAALAGDVGSGRTAGAGLGWWDGATVDATVDFAGLAMVKSAAEVDEIARRVEMAWHVQRDLAEALQRGATEIQLYSLARSSAQELWGAPVEMVADVLGGPSCARVAAPLAVPGSRFVEWGESLIADLVLGADGYFADVTWTHVRGESPEVEHLREGLVGVMEHVAGELVPGRPARDVYYQMVELLGDLSPRFAFPHHAGHGIGLSGYEAPFLAPFDDTPLAAGMVVALEPGLYGQGVGARVERDYLITPDGGVEVPGRHGDFGGDRD